MAIVALSLSFSALSFTISALSSSVSITLSSSFSALRFSFSALSPVKGQPSSPTTIEMWRWMIPCYVPLRMIGAQCTWVFSSCFPTFFSPPRSWPLGFTTLLASMRAIMYSFVCCPVGALRFIVSRTSQQTWMPHIDNVGIRVRKSNGQNLRGEWISTQRSDNTPSSPPTCIMLYIHGGAFALCTPATHKGDHRRASSGPTFQCVPRRHGRLRPRLLSSTHISPPCTAGGCRCMLQTAAVDDTTAARRGIGRGQLGRRPRRAGPSEYSRRSHTPQSNWCPSPVPLVRP
mmetsp:Transcript_20020/g.40093  ORF Transcript_20020/g.40093 Transcript_20020/m.40093 type:complete len:288 (-) Transcript_20020:455-1318(-)